MSEEEKTVEVESAGFGSMGFDSDFFDEGAEAKKEEKNVGSKEEQENSSETESSKEVEKENKPPSNDTKDDSSLVNVLAGDLYEKGAISSYNSEELGKIIEEKGEAEAARYIITSEIDVIKENTKKLYDEQFQEFTRLRESGFSPEQATQNISAKGQLDAITDEAFVGEESEGLIKNLMLANLQRTTQMSTEQAEEFIQYKLDTAQDGGVSEGKKALELLKAGVVQDEKAFIKNQEEAAIKQSQALEERKADLKKSINETTEFIKGVSTNDKIKDRMYSIITDPVAEIDGQPVNELTRLRSEDPKGFEMKMAYLAATGYFDSKEPWDKLNTAVQTKESSRLKDFLDNQTNNNYNIQDGVHRTNNKNSEPDPFDVFTKRK